MIQLDPNNARYDGVEARRTDGKRYELAFALRQWKKRVMLQVPSGLVVSSDDEVRRKLTQVLRQCALVPVLASTVAESQIVLAGHEISLVVCNDRMDDGQYEDIVKLAVRAETKLPVIVVSRTGDVPEYLTAIRGVVDRVSGEIAHSGGQGKTVRPAPFFKRNGHGFPLPLISAATRW